MQELEWLRQIVEATTSFVGATDANGTPLWVNPAGRALCGLGPDGALPSSIAAFHPPWAAWRVMSEGLAVADRDGVWHGETAVIDSDGNEVPVQQMVIAHHDANGQLEALSTVMRDLRESRRLAENVTEQARMLGAIGEAVIVSDAEGNVEYWNRAAERLYGWTANEARGRHVGELTVGRSESDSAEEILAALRRGQVWAGVFTVRDREGREFPAWVSDTPVLDERGQVRRIIGVSTDISELQAARTLAQRRADQQAAIAHLGQRILDTADLDEVSALVCDELADIVDADACAVFALDDDAALRLVAGTGWPPGQVGQATVEADASSLMADTLAHDVPIVVADIGAESRFTLPPLLAAQGAGSAACARIRHQQASHGVLVVHRRRSQAFDQDDAACVRSAANLLGSAVDRDRTARELHHVALHDPLTGLPNRVRLVDRIESAIADCRARDTRLGVVVLDVDDFKLVNDGLGHLTGDRLLRDAADRLRRTAAGCEAVGRLGGDEFAVVLDRLGGDAAVAAEQCRELATELRDAVSGPYDLPSGRVHVTASVGIAVDTGDEDAHGLLRNAQAAVSSAQQRERGGVGIYDEQLRRRAAERLELTTALRHAIGNDQLRLAYQPQLDLRTGEVVGLEALVRWQHPERGLLAPGAFLDIAEETGLITAIGRWVLRRVCRDAASLPPEQVPALSVNVSAHQLSDLGFADTVEDALRAAGLPAERLVLEFTETTILAHAPTALETLSTLRARGVRVAVDDFGTGYSSLTHLADFPISLIKIDRSFVASMPAAGRRRQIVEAMVRLAQTMHLGCVAEGVETVEQLDDLRAMGCELGQGYLWSRPLPLDEIRAWVAER